MNRKPAVLEGIRFFALCSAGGFVLASAGLSVGWMMGSLLVAACHSFRHPAKSDARPENRKIGLRIGQCILGMELGQRLNLSVLAMLKEHSITIALILSLSIFCSWGAGYLLHKVCKTDLLTSFLATAPGGLSAMPALAQELGANTAVVTLNQTIRIFLVVLTIPLIVSGMANPAVSTAVPHVSPFAGTADFRIASFLWTIVLAVSAWGGYHLGRFLKFPAPWLVGSLITVALVQNLGNLYAGGDVLPWWPENIMSIAQILIGASVGASFQKSMFIGIGKTFLVSFFATAAFIMTMLACAYVVSRLTGIAVVTTSLAFAPGGVAEMTSTAVALRADSMFVVAVQVIRIVVVNATLPPLFKLLHDQEKSLQKKETFRDVDDFRK
ncbi:AbrB family transcriptional regulator [Brevibacillus marinus]|uniref:AbrB family transcriptional regulator n=1 Tax=Brevibacillus marinus TaxID=2496837 RepID=UPI000F82E515|nr:AbrB family transcriptional regulator [Brevibacillus marinus]